MNSWEAKEVCVDQHAVDELKAELAELCKGLFIHKFDCVL